MSVPDEHADSEPHAAYAGRWIAELRGRVIAQGGTPAQAARAAQANRHKEKPIIRYVSTSTPLTFAPLLYEMQPAVPDDATVYLVGGAIRDALMNRVSHDLDFAVDGNALTVSRQIADAMGGAYFPLDTEHKTGRVVFTLENGKQMMLDFASLRGPTLEADLRARDFTINAIAANVRAPQQLLDPLGGGLDIFHKRLRMCSNRAFEDDPLRVLRAVRQAAAFSMMIEPTTRKAMRAAAPKLAEVSGERQRDEVLKILSGPQPATALRALEMLGALEPIFPELAALKDTPQSPPHIYNVWEHTLQTVQKLETVLGVLAVRDHDPVNASNYHMGSAVMKLGRYRDQFHAHLAEELVPERTARGLLFLAALYHDIGKPATRSVDADGRIRFFGHEEEGRKIVSQRGQALKLSNIELTRLKAVVGGHMRPHYLASAPKPPTRRAIFRFFRKMDEAAVDICLLNLADLWATSGNQLTEDLWLHYLNIHRTLLEAYYEKPEEAVRPPRLITGKDIIDLFDVPQGPKIGELLEKLLEVQADGEITTREDALAFIEEQIK